jgi:hypothetical protein
VPPPAAPLRPFLRQCPLCLENKELVSSHLIPRAMYTYCRTADSEPVLFTTEVMMQTSRQLQHRLLCGDCEDLLNKGGEHWLLPLLATIDKKFPLLDIIEKLPPDLTDSEGRGYAASNNPEIKVDKLIHFAMGVFWKASIHSWRGDGKEPQIELGPYRDNVRVYLRGEAPFPKCMGLVMGVLPREKALISFTQPYRGSAKGCHNFMFYIPGIQFVLSVGKRLPIEMPNICFASNSAHPILVADFSEDVSAVFRRVASKAHKSKKLVEHMKTRPRS